MFRIKAGGTLILAGFGVTACGAATAAIVHSAGHAVDQAIDVPHAAGAAAAAATPAAPSTPHPTPVATPTPTAAPAQYIAIFDPAGAQSKFEILGSNGDVVASTLANPAESWASATGPGGVYWIEGTAVHELAVNGAFRTVGAVPAGTETLLVSPDGTQYAFATSTPSKAGTAVIENRIYAQPFGATSHLIADRVSDPAHPSSDAPPAWDYDLMSWTSRGILFARVPVGGCGCGPFDMEMQSADTALIDPSNGATTAVTRDASCPLSGYSPAGGAACFRSGSKSFIAIALDVQRPSGTAVTVSMSGTNVAGDATFSSDGSRVAYVTLPAADASCGGPQDTTLRVMTLSSKTANAFAVHAFSLFGWMDDGALFGSVTNGSSSRVVTVDPDSGHVTTLWSGASGIRVVGLVGG